MSKPIRTDLTIGRLYALKDFADPFIWMGDRFECLWHDYFIPPDARFNGDYWDTPTDLKDYTSNREVPNRKRFSSL